MSVDKSASGYCIDNLEDTVCSQAPVDVLAAACAKNFTTTCKMRARELDGVTAGTFCSTHPNDPFCSCYTAAAPNWTKSCVGYKPKNFLEDPDKRLRDVIEAIKVNQARIAAEVTANAIELDAAKKLAASSEGELNVVNADLDALNAVKIKILFSMDEIAKIKDMLSPSQQSISKIKDAFNMQRELYASKPVYQSVTEQPGGMTYFMIERYESSVPLPEDVKKYNDLVTEVKNILIVIKNRSDSNLTYASQTQLAVTTLVNTVISRLEGPYSENNMSKGEDPVEKSYKYIKEATEYSLIKSQIVDIIAQIQGKEQARLQAVTRFQDAKNTLTAIQTKVDARTAENAAIMAMLNVEKKAAEAAVNDSGSMWLWIIIILLVAIASYVIYKFTQKKPENYVNY